MEEPTKNNGSSNTKRDVSKVNTRPKAKDYNRLSEALKKNLKRRKAARS